MTVYPSALKSSASFSAIVPLFQTASDSSVHKVQALSECHICVSGPMDLAFVDLAVVEATVKT